MINNIAGCIMSFNRPEYLYQNIKYLENCTDTEDIEWYLLQDGAVNKFSDNRYALDENIEKCITIFKQSNLENKTVIKNEYNLGVGLQRQKMFELFDDYNVIIQIEDDLLVGKYGIRLMKLMISYFRNSVPTIYRDMDINKIDNYMNKLDLVLASDIWNTFSMGMTKYIYKIIKSDWNDYIDLIDNVDYRLRPHKQINDRFPDGVSSSDAVLAEILEKNDLNCIKPAVSRGKYIGEKGLHYSPESYAKHDHGKEGQLEYENGANMYQLRLKYISER